MSVSQEQRIIDLVRAGHDVTAVGQWLGVNESTVITALRDLSVGSVTQEQRIFDLVLAGHDVRDVNGWLDVSLGTVLTAIQDLAGTGSGTSPSTPGSGGSGSPPPHRFPFTFDMPNLHSGVVVEFEDGYTPVVGDLLMNAWFEIETGWDGTTPAADVGQMLGGYGWFGNLFTGAVNIAVGSEDVDYGTGTDGLLVGVRQSLAEAAVFTEVQIYLQLNAIPPTQLPLVNQLETSESVLFPSYERLPGRFTNTNPIKVVVSQTGKTDGADPGATQGSAVLYVVTATPTPP